jgi:hypothetical protein
LLDGTPRLGTRSPVVYIYVVRVTAGMFPDLLVGTLNGFENVPDRPPSIGRAAAPECGHAEGLRKRMNELKELPAGVLRFQNIKA